MYLGLVLPKLLAPLSIGLKNVVFGHTHPIHTYTFEHACATATQAKQNFVF